MLEILTFPCASLDAAANLPIGSDEPFLNEDIRQRIAMMNVAKNEALSRGGVERQQFRRECTDVAVIGDIEHPQGNDLVVVLRRSSNQRRHGSLKIADYH